MKNFRKENSDILLKFGPENVEKEVPWEWIFCAENLGYGEGGKSPENLGLSKAPVLVRASPVQAFQKVNTRRPPIGPDITILDQFQIRNRNVKIFVSSRIHFQDPKGPEHVFNLLRHSDNDQKPRETPETA